MSIDVLGMPTQEGNVEALKELIAALVGTAAKLRLFKETFSPTPLSVEADFEAAECDFSGYAAGVLTFGAVGIDQAGNGICFSSRTVFQNTTGVVGNSVGGVWISVEQSPGPPVVSAALRYFKFQTPIAMTVALQTLGVVAVYMTPNLNGQIMFDN